ncbi:hypothetical protein PVAP13_9NG699314 [Panicum virgatum]|uniref:Uncharacterized protein n=1 Tax=Panicum virgatum TaxID=38727 RepID=A0A8T0N3Z9_PANVG|nr:hypothetical protein PVAP13_9NG699314 [Panicum virgatum]
MPPPPTGPPPFRPFRYYVPWATQGYSSCHSFSLDRVGGRRGKASSSSFGMCAALARHEPVVVPRPPRRSFRLGSSAPVAAARWRDRCVRVGHLGPVLSGAAGSHALGMGAPRRDGESAVASPPTCKLTPPNSGPGAAAGRERARERSPGAFRSGTTSPFPVSPANGRLSGALSFSPTLPAPG